MADKTMNGELTKKFKERDQQLDEIYNMMGTANTKAQKEKPKKKSWFGK